jgi:hypothetical protein
MKWPEEPKTVWSSLKSGLPARNLTERDVDAHRGLLIIVARHRACCHDRSCSNPDNS